MNWIVLSVLVLFALMGVIIWILRSRSGDIEEVILQGRPILLRCGKLRVNGKASVCGQSDATLKV